MNEVTNIKNTTGQMRELLRFSVVSQRKRNRLLAFMLRKRKPTKIAKKIHNKEQTKDIDNWEYQLTYIERDVKELSAILFDYDQHVKLLIHCCNTYCRQEIDLFTDDKRRKQALFIAEEKNKAWSWLWRNLRLIGYFFVVCLVYSTGVYWHDASVYCDPNKTKCKVADWQFRIPIADQIQHLIKPESL